MKGLFILILFAVILSACDDVQDPLSGGDQKWNFDFSAEMLEVRGYYFEDRLWDGTDELVVLIWMKVENRSDYELVLPSNIAEFVFRFQKNSQIYREGAVFYFELSQPPVVETYTELKDFVRRDVGYKIPAHSSAKLNFYFEWKMERPNKYKYMDEEGMELILCFFVPNKSPQEFPLDQLIEKNTTVIYSQ